MKKRHIAVFVLIGMVLGAAISSLVYWKVVSRVEGIATACAIMNAAVNNQLLTTEQVKKLGEYSHSALNQQSKWLAANFKWDQEKLANASPDSNCSQFLVGFNQAEQAK